jgi:DNA-binding transcriptional regulator LsrR (DeoR family)
MRGLDSAQGRLCAKVADLYYKAGLSQTQIGQRLSLSPARVSRALRQATESGIVVSSIVEPPETHVALERTVEERFNLREVVIAPGASDATQDDLALTAAAYLEATLFADDLVGLSSWSATLLSTVEAMHAMPKTTVNRVVQMIGGAGHPNAQIHAMRLVSRFSEIVSAEAFFLSAPGLAESPEQRNELMDDPRNVQAMSLWSEISCAIVGIGPIPQSSFLRESGNALNKDLLALAEEQGVVGEVCLRFFDDQGRDVASALDQYVVSIDIETYRKIPKRIGIANGANKHTVIRAALLGGWVNVLITDAATATYLAEADWPTISPRP